MAAALPPPRPDSGPSALVSDTQLQPYSLQYPLTEFDLTTNRFSTHGAADSSKRMSVAMYAPASLAIRDQQARSPDSTQRSRSSPAHPGLPLNWQVEGLDEVIDREEMRDVEPNVDVNDQRLPQQTQAPSPEGAMANSLPPGAQAARRELYSLDGERQPGSPNAPSTVTKPVTDTTTPRTPPGSPPAWQQTAPYATMQTGPSLSYPSSPRRPSLPAIGAISGGNMDSASQSLSPTRGFPVPISPRPRASAQQPTYVTPPTATNAMSPMFSSNPPVPQEEICLECAMRDQDMADVDVTSPGTWDRESDVLYEELLRREEEDQLAGIISHDRPRAKGGRLTEQNLKLWMTVNPREPASRQQTIDTYIKSQRTLLEAEALAHARAMQESRQLDNRMRDAYSQLRRSAYEMGASANPVDDLGGVRIKAPSQRSRPHSRTHSRDVTLLENGMIVEHVDVKREEREERERRRREERRERSRARKSSRSSAVDVTSLYSVQSFTPRDDGQSLRPSTRYSQSLAGRPASVLTAPPADRRPSLPHAYSHGALSDIHSLGAPSPRNKFFGSKNRSQGWRSQDSLAASGMSGSMIDMHLALDGQSQHMRSLDGQVQMATFRQSQAWPITSVPPHSQTAVTKSEKKRGGLAKIWRIISWNKSDVALNSRTRSTRAEDDGPLAPPPPLSYLMSRAPGDLNLGSPRHASTPSLPSTASPRNVLSSPVISAGTAPSSIIPSPSSSRPPASDREAIAGIRKSSRTAEDMDQPVPDEIGKMTLSRNVHSIPSEHDSRRINFPNSQSNSCTSPSLRPMPSPSPRPQSSLAREKSLPPLPAEAESTSRLSVPQQSPRPQSTFTPDVREIAHDAGAQARPQTFFTTQTPQRDSDSRRKSFGGSTARPDLAIPPNGLMPDPRRFPEEKYNEFGHPQSAIQLLQDQLFSSSVTPSLKRRSKFGLSNLLPKKASSQAQQRFPVYQGYGQDYGALQSYEGDEVASNGYATSLSRHSVLSGPTPRISVVSRKAIDELVAQDREFIAYRYPSNEQGLELQR